MITRVSDSFLFTLMVSALFCAESAAPENAMAQKMVKIFSSLYYTNFTAAKVWQENEKNYSVIHMNWSVFPKYHPGNSLSINTLVYLTNMREKLPSDKS